MNTIEAMVDEIQESDVVTYIRIRSNNTMMSVIKAKAPKWIGVGESVYCTFQEVSVSVSKDCPGKVSIENRVPATLKEVRKNDSLCELTFESDIGTVISLITLRAYESLELEKGCRATMLLRGVDINIEPIFTPIDIDKYTNLKSRTKDAD